MFEGISFEYVFKETLIKNKLALHLFSDIETCSGSVSFIVVLHGVRV